MAPRPNFGLRAPVGAASASLPPGPPGPPRLRSGVVMVGAIGLLTIAIAAYSASRDPRCQTRSPGDPEPRPDWCNSSGGHGGHAFFGGSSSGSAHGGSHASFGGFGGHGSGHGGG